MEQSEPAATGAQPLPGPAPATLAQPAVTLTLAPIWWLLEGVWVAQVRPEAPLEPVEHQARLWALAKVQPGAQAALLAVRPLKVVARL